MPKWNEGDRVRVVERKVTDEDRKKNRYFEHMAGLVGNVQQVYSDTEIAVQVDRATLGDVTAEVHKMATQRMKEKFMASISEEQRRGLSKEEQDFDANYVLLVQSSDLEKA